MWCGTLRSVSRISGLLWNPVKLSLQSRILAFPGYKCLDKYNISRKGISTSCNLMQTKDSDAGAQKSGYDIYYWPGAPGRAEFIRLIFAEVGETYKDVDDIEGIETVSLSTQTEGFPNYAPPVLKDGDFLLAQTPVICRYLGEKFGLVPENKTDRWRADQLNATLHDFIAEGCLVFHAKNFVEEYCKSNDISCYKFPLLYLNFSSTSTAALCFHMMAYGLPVNEDERGADICSHPPFYCSVLDVSTLAFILWAIRKPAHKNTVLPYVRRGSCAQAILAKMK